MALYMTVIVLSLLYLQKVTASNTDETNITENLNPSSEDVILDLSFFIHTELNNDNFTFNTSVFEFTTVTLPKRRGKVRHRQPPSLPSSAFLDHLDQFAMPIALCMGILGNIVTFLIFIYTPLKGNSLSHYLAAMAVSDFLYLVSCLIVWTSKQGLTIYQTVGVCQLTQFFLRISRFLSTWYLFAAHVERFLVNFGSFRATTWCSTFRTKFIIIIVFIFSLVAFLHYIWTHVLLEFRGKLRCMIMPESFKHLIQLGKIEIIAAIFLPMLLIVLIDVALCVNTIAKRYKFYFRVPSKNGSVKSNPGPDDLGDYALASHRRSGCHPNAPGESNPPPPEYDLSLERRSATLVVVICGLIFIGLLLPNSGFTAKMYFVPDIRLTASDMRTSTLFEQLVKFNSVYKFLLYFILLKPFRKGIVYLFTCRGKKNPEENTFQETTEV